MQAARIHEHGGPEIIRLDDVPVPEPSAGEVLVKVLAASVNHLDLWVRRGMPGFTIPFPRTLGSDGTAEVVSVGEGVEGFSPGQPVVILPGVSSIESERDMPGREHLARDYGIRGEHCDGVDCEYLVLEARYLLPLPDGVDPVPAAAVPLVFLTARTHHLDVHRETRARQGVPCGLDKADVQCRDRPDAHFEKTQLELPRHLQRPAHLFRLLLHARTGGEILQPFGE